MDTRPQSFATTSAFEILGPIMVGPSSSHTAGALRCARVAASLVHGTIVSVQFTLWNSFAHTYKGHGTDRALLGGILGFDTDDERIRNAFELAAKQGLNYEFAIGGDDPTLHPNTVDIELVSSTDATATIRGESLGGGRMRVSAINGVQVDISGLYTTLFVEHKDAPGALAALTSALAQAKMNIAFCRTYRKEAGGLAYSVFETDGNADATVLPHVQKLELVQFATFIELPGSASALSPGVSVPELFDDASQLLAATQERNLSIGAIMRMREEQLIGKVQAAANMQRVIDVMRAASQKPLEQPQRSLGGFLDGEAKAVADTASTFAPKLMGSVQTDAVARAMAVLERSASMGVIVAAPTAGSAGVIPGCMLALANELEINDEQLSEALYTAAAIGLILTTSACVAGAEGGCQAEVGSAAAMAAAALVHMCDGTPEEALHASSITLANLLGLVCDPVGGLVEVPCQNRNAIGVAAAFSAAQLALAGVKSLVPFDEMAATMLSVGKSLPATLRETAQGGIAIAPSAQSACARCGICT